MTTKYYRKHPNVNESKIKLNLIIYLCKGKLLNVMILGKDLVMQKYFRNNTLSLVKHIITYLYNIQLIV